jgi:hypothetical protein
MGNVTRSGQNNITSPNGNSLALFVDGVTEEMKVKDIMGNIETLSDYIPTIIVQTGNYGLFAQTSDSTPITSTIVESGLLGTGVGTLSVPANSFSVGDSFSANMSGLMSAKNNDSITIRIKSGSVVLANSGALSLPSITNQVWNLTISFTIRTIGGVNVASIVTFGEMHILKLASGTQQGFGFNTINNTTFDTTIPNTLSVTAEWSSNSALNSIYTDIFVLNKIY